MVAVLSAQPRDALGLADDVGDADAELVVHDHRLAARHQPVVDQDVQRLARDLVELDDRARPERPADPGSSCAPDPARPRVEGNVQQQVEPALLIGGIRHRSTCACSLSNAISGKRWARTDDLPRALGRRRSQAPVDGDGQAAADDARRSAQSCGGPARSIGSGDDSLPSRTSRSPTFRSSRRREAQTVARPSRRARSTLTFSQDRPRERGREARVDAAARRGGDVSSFLTGSTVA